jgi:hypothetical protein
MNSKTAMLTAAVVSLCAVRPPALVAADNPGTEKVLRGCESRQERLCWPRTRLRGPRQNGRQSG